jgi:polysaccharide pyruvyl transferase WcaK-like protein
MTILDFFRNTSLENSLLVGFYGGGNYGDELLMEVMQGFFKQQRIKDLKIYYQDPPHFSVFHQDLGYGLVDGRSKRHLLTSLVKCKNVLIGGGGLWGMDANVNILLLGILLFLGKILGKKIYLIGVGYYGSTNTYGSVSAYLTGLASTLIFARDQESFQNFKKINPATYLDKDLAFYLSDLKTVSFTQTQVLPFDLKKTPAVVITLRRFKDSRGDTYSQLIKQLVIRNPQIHFILLLLEPKFIDPEGYAFIKNLGKYKHVEFYDFSYNPLLLVQFFQAHHQQLALIAPQYHAIITAILSKTAFFPIVYDNKVRELLQRLRVKGITPIKELKYEQFQQFVEQFVKK